MTYARLRGTTALVVAVGLALPAHAQEAVEDDTYLGTLTLTAGKRDIATGSAIAQTTVDQEEIEDRQASTIAQLIDSVPGVTLVNGSTPQGSGINIRGYGANNTYGSDQKIAIIVDGATVGSEELYRIGTQLFTDPFLYRNVEVLRGTIGSFEYGSGIVGGVVKLETKSASDFTGGVPGLRFGQTFEFSSNRAGVTSSSILAWQPSERAEFLFNYTWRTQDDQRDGGGDIIDNSAFTTPSGLIKAHFTFGEALDQSLTLSLSRTIADDKDVPYDTFQTTDAVFGNVDRYTDTSQASLAYRWNPAGNDLVDLEATLSYADQKIDLDYVPGSSVLEGTPGFAGLLPLVNADHRYRTTKLTLKNTARFATGAVDHELRTGVDLIRRKRDDETAASAPGGTDDRVAVFAIDEMRIGGFTVTPALRWETSTVEDTAGNRFENDATMGGLALAYEFAGGFAVFGSASYTAGLPIIDDVGNPLFMSTVESARTWEIGASYAGQNVFAEGDTLAVRAGLYDTRMWDITSYTVAGSMGTQLDSVETRGFELEASYGFATGYYVDLNGHLGEGTEFNPDGTSGTWRNSPADAVALTVGRKWDNDRIDLSWEVVHNADTRDGSGTVLPDSTVHNLRATFRPQQGVFRDSKVRVGIENLFDKEYVGHLSSSSRPAPGRTLKLTVSKLF